MTDQQPEDPAARTPLNPAPPDPTKIDGDPAAPAAARAGAARENRAQGEQEPPARWSGSAAVPPHVPKRAWWSRRSGESAADEPAPPADPWADSEDWSATPAVDPWADQDTPWQAEVPFPEAMPPTRIESALPPTRMESPLPPTRMESPPAPGASSPAVGPPPSAQTAPLPARAAPAPRPATSPQPTRGQPAAGGPPVRPSGPTPPTASPPPRRRGWGRRNGAKQAPPPAPNRVPVQQRPPAPWAPPGRPQPGRPPHAGPPPPPPRRKRRWGRKLLLFTLVSAVCCCGVPAYLASPATRQHPVSAALPPSLADLDLRDDGASRKAVERLSEQLSGTNLVKGEVFAGVYADGNGKRVTVFGTTGLRFTPKADVEAGIAHLSSEYAIKEIQTYDLGETGVHERCGVGRSGGKAVVVCAWADHGSLATVLLTRRSVEESADLTGVVRNAVLTRG